MEGEFPALMSTSDKFQICMKGNQVENICERLADEYHKQQPMSNQTLLHNRFKALKLAMLRLPMTEATDFKAADIYADLILTSIQVWPFFRKKRQINDTLLQT